MKGGVYTNIQGDFKQDIPQYEIEMLARLILPKIQEYYESDEGKKDFEDWMKQEQS